MFNSLLTGVLLALATGPVLAQGAPPRACLHGADESADQRTRRQQAIDYVTKVNVAEGARAALSGKYLALDALTNVPARPAGFDVQFHYDDRSYTLSLKDTRDMCHYAIFT